MKKRKRTASLMKLENPEYLSLVTKPANKTGFKIIRSAEQRSDGELLRIDFPLGIDEMAAGEIAEAMGLQDDYTLRGSQDEGFYLIRKGSEEDPQEGSTLLDMGHGFSAVVRMDLGAGEGGPVSGVKLLRLEFDQSFELEGVRTWLKDREIDFRPNGVESADSGTVVVRHESVGGEEKVQIMPGVVGVVCRAAEDDVPASISREVIEQAYGNCGWGHFSFASAMADVEFTEKSWDAISVLQDVLETVVLDSGLPLDERKSLIRNACNQYASYMAGLLDVLPTGVIEQMRDDRNSTRETETMPKSVKAQAEKQAEEVARSDDEQATETATAEENHDEDEQGGEAPKYVTRGDVEEIVTKAVAAAFTAQAEATKRADEDTTGKDEESDPVIDTLKSFGETLKDISEKVERMSESHDSLKGEVDELAGTTVARSDEEDSSPDEASVKRSENASPFNGMFGDHPFNL